MTTDSFKEPAKETNVVSLYGDEIPKMEPVCEPRPEVIAALEGALEKALAGKAAGVFLILTSHDLKASAHRAGAACRATLGVLELAKHDLVELLAANNG